MPPECQELESVICHVKLYFTIRFESDFWKTLAALMHVVPFSVNSIHVVELARTYDIIVGLQC